MFQINFTEVDPRATEFLKPLVSIMGIYGLILGFLMICYDLQDIRENFGRSIKVTTFSWFILLVCGLQPGLSYFQLINQQIIFFI